ncbi:pentatricopeptide repeat-containing protein At2g20540-like [Dioscorea cayenensis subsp. rotundata]|uniref:Pentatricopeptide repeat-containing protein At2g20540-like n=1 Tax=Dioscorea cayennensis subsp. rotundata TaxID=55577 RepID=A0AB40AHK1_DIOCR|nr:pentatricopeptide repeat-containing protein At2g20540-like [Dioscorea cayenensis subsp. rotundata]
MRLPFPPETLIPPKTLIEVRLLHSHLIVHGSLTLFLLPKLIHLYSLAGAPSPALRLLSDHPYPPPSSFPPLLSSLPPPLSLHLYSSARRLHPPDPFLLPPTLRSAPPLLIPSLHADALKSGCRSSPHVLPALISSYARIPDLISAHKAFDDGDHLHRRQALTFNSLLSAYVSSGAITPALNLLISMQSDGYDPDIVTHNIIINGLCRAARCDDALHLFNRLLRPNLVSWTTIIVGYSRCANHEAALHLFRRMMITAISDSSVLPDHDTLSCVISSCRHVSCLRNGRAIHCYGIKSCKPDPEAFYSAAGAALVVMYAGGGEITAAERVFRLMDHDDVVTWNAMIVGFARVGKADVAMEHFKEMQVRGIGHDQTTLATVLTVCDLKRGREIHALRLRNYYESDTLLCDNALMCMYSRLGCIDHASSIFRTMSVKDLVSWNTMIGGCGSHGRAKDSIKLFHDMVKSGVKPNMITMTNVLMACSHGGLVDEGMKLIKCAVREYDVVVTSEQCACVVDMLSRAGRFEEVVELAGEIEGGGGSVWGAMLAACEVYESVEFGKVAFDALVRLEPENAGNYVTMASIYCKAGMWDEAKKVRRMIDGKGLVKPAGNSWIHVGAIK